MSRSSPDQRGPPSGLVYTYQRNIDRNLTDVQSDVMMIHIPPIRLIVLLLIRKSITSLRKHIEKVTERLPVYYDEEEMMSQGSLHHKDTTLESMVGHEVKKRSLS